METVFTPAQTLRSMLVALHPVIAALAARDEMAVAEYNRVTWLMSVPDEQLVVMARWVEIMHQRFVEVLTVIEVNNVS